MRLSTQSYYQRSIAAMLDQQSALSRIQNQVASGKKITSPADDPIAAVHIMELERSKQEYGQYDKNSALARNRLNLEESAIADAGTVLQRVRELILQASNTGTLTALTVTVVVQRTPGVSYSGQYNTVGGQITQANSSTTSAITYTFTLSAGQSLGPSTSRTFAVQTGGNGTLHPTSGDTWTVTYTSGGQQSTASGTF